MSLITRCPACGTMFKIVPDQLRISEGWVRCGHCTDIFDASRHLQSREEVAQAAADGSYIDADAGFDQGTAEDPAPAAEADAPPPSPPPVPQAEPPAVWVRRSVANTLLRRTATGAPVEDDAALDEIPDEPQASEPAPVPEDESAAPPVPVLSEDVPSALLLQTADTDMPQSMLYEPAFAVPTAPLAGTAEEAAEPDEDEDAVLQQLGFVRDAERRAFWRRPAVVVASLLVCAGLLLLLLLQAGLQERDRIAAMAPSLRPALAALCAPLSCSVGPRRQIDAVVIEGSAFNKTRGDLYQFSLDLRNTAHTPLAMPALELTLSDADGQPLVRRVLMPEELRAPTVLPTRGVWSGVLPVQLQELPGGARVAGYSLLAFYP
ncbi:DUF3426 domain-containing protein [Xylophilus sp. GW821-FHT01B05]